jgi:hypothetical protein
LIGPALAGTALVGVTILGVIAAEGVPATPAQPTVSGQVIVAKVCGRGEVETLVKAFIRAFNGGEPESLNRAFAEDPDFKWYSTDAPGRRVLPIAADRSTLMRYFARRHTMSESLQLRSFRFNGNTPAVGKPYGNFQFRLLRRASNLPATRYHGKGAAHCYAIQPDAIIVWSMARE